MAEGLPLPANVTQEATYVEHAKPSILRDKRGRVQWRLPGNTEDQNLQIGIQNVQALFVEKFPEFAAIFLSANGIVPLEKQEEARKFILKVVGNRKIFDNIIGGSSVQKEAAPYFEGKFKVVIDKSFAPWGLDFSESEEKLVCLNEDQSTSEIVAMPQKKGLLEVTEYMYEKRPIDEVSPFIIDEVFIGKNDKMQRLFLSEIRRGKSILCGLNEKMQQIIRNRGRILAVPRFYKNLYQWIDFYEINSISNNMSVDLSCPIGSYKIDRKDYTICSEGWWGYKNALLVDYLLDHNGIIPQQLEEFTVPINQSKVATIAYIDGKSLQTFVNLSEINIGQKLKLRPNYDLDRDYVWIDGYVVTDKGEEKILSRRIFKGNIRFYDWNGPERQALVDWISGDLPFDKVTAIQVPFVNKSPVMSLGKGPKGSIRVQAQREIAKKLDKITIIPRKDELYEWIELQTPGDGLSVPDTIALQRIMRNGSVKLIGGWCGPERQRYIDYFDGKLKFNDLKPCKVKISSKGQVYFLHYKGKDINLRLGENKQFLIRKNVTVIPLTDQNGQLILAVCLEDTDKMIGKIVYDTVTEDFEITKVIEKDTIVTDISPEEAWKVIDMFFD